MTNRISIIPRPLSPGELSNLRRLRVMAQKRQQGIRKHTGSITVMRPSKGLDGGWLPEND